MPGKEIVKPERKLIPFERLPERFTQIIDPQGWANAILFGDPYDEPDPEFISRMLAAKAIFGETDDDLFAMSGIKRLQQWVPNTPGATTGPMEITDIYVAKSDFSDGNGTFVIITAVLLTDGTEVKMSTGATNVQATLIGLLRTRPWPFQVQIKRGDSKDKGERYLLFMLPPD